MNPARSFGPALAWLYGWANCMAIQAGACAVIAVKRDLTALHYAELAAVVLYPVIIGVAIAQFGLGVSDEGEAAAHEAPAAADKLLREIEAGETLYAEPVRPGEPKIMTHRGSDVL